MIATGVGLLRQAVKGSTFGDVSASAWYLDALSIANEYGIVQGYEDGLFHGEQQITREQGMTMIARAFNLIEPQGTKSEAEVNVALSSYWRSNDSFKLGKRSRSFADSCWNCPGQ